MADNRADIERRLIQDFGEDTLALEIFDAEVFAPSTSDASTEPVLSTVALSAAIGAGTGDADVSATLPIAIVTSPTGNAVGVSDGAASASLPTVTTIAPEATAEEVTASEGAAHPPKRVAPMRVTARAEASLPDVTVFPPIAFAEGTRHAYLSRPDLREWRSEWLAKRRNRCA